MITLGRAAILAALTFGVSGQVRCQVEDSTPTLRHILAIDFARIKPFRRSYDIVAHAADSVRVIGRREVSFEEIGDADSSAGWWLVETRTGVVASVDSILLAPDLRPVRWSSTLGAATLNIAFTADSLIGAIRAGRAGARLSSAIPPDLVVSAAELELLATLVPSAAAWSDSVHALAITFGGASVESAELSAAEDSVATESGASGQPAWVLVMRAGSKESRVWVDRETGAVLRAQQLLPSHVGAVLEYRVRQAPTTP